MPFVLPFALLLTEATAPSVRVVPPLAKKIATTAAPPVIQSGGYRVAPQIVTERPWNSRRRATIAVEALGGGQTLWSGTLRVGTSAGASVNRSMNQAPPYDCPGDERGRYRAQQNSFNLNLNMQNHGEQGPSYSFSVNWQRPTEDCSDAMVQRSVQLSGSTALDSGKTVTVEGDAGLMLRMRLVSESDGGKTP